MTTRASGGRLEVICGPMFSGKSGELIRRLQRATDSGIAVAAFKSHLDVRHEDARLSSHDGLRFPCTPIRLAGEALESAGDATIVGIDEAQFFDRDLVRVCLALVQGGKRVIVAGLHEDYLGEPFDPMPELARLADDVRLLVAVCTICGDTASHSQRIGGGDGRVFVGGAESYEPRCSRCFQPGVSGA